MRNPHSSFAACSPPDREKNERKQRSSQGHGLWMREMRLPPGSHQLGPPIPAPNPQDFSRAERGETE